MQTGGAWRRKSQPGVKEIFKKTVANTGVEPWRMCKNVFED